MSLEQTAEQQSRKRKREHHQTPSAFWDNLSRQWLTPRALREFDRRTIHTAAPIPPDQSTLQKSHIAQLRRVARRGGLDLSDLRAYPEQAVQPHHNRTMRSHRLRPTEAESSNTQNPRRKTTAYDAAFEQHLIDHRIYPDGYADHSSDDDGDEEHGSDDDPSRPNNLEDINHRLMQPRSSSSPSRFLKTDLQRFRRKNREAFTEAKVMSSVFPMIAGNKNITSQEGILFNNLAPLTDRTTATPKPDFYDGARLERVDQKVRKELGRFIAPSKGRAPILPNFFLEAKGPKGLDDVAQLQACYDGAVGARAMQYMRSYGGEMQYDGNAYTLMSTYNKGTLRIYTTHITEPAELDGRPGYYTALINGWDMMGNVGTFREGVAAFRNGREWAKGQRDIAIALANEKARGNHEDTHAE